MHEIGVVYSEALNLSAKTSANLYCIKRDGQSDGQSNRRRNFDIESTSKFQLFIEKITRRKKVLKISR